MRSFVHKQLKAFTLLELLVGMIISGIVVAASFNAYRVISAQFKSYKITAALYNSFSFLEAQLHSDFKRANELHQTDEHSIRMNFREQTINWQFNEKYALRNDGTSADTFFVGVSRAEMFYKAEKVTEDEQRVTELKLKLKIGGHSSEIDCKKEEAADMEIKTEFEKWCADGN